MALACQRNSYLRELTTTVKSCSPGKLVIQNGGKKETVTGFEVILEDTVLFPEGGGQPDDRGTINGVPVLNVCRRGQTAIHFVATEIPEGSEVKLEVDWARRFDHMQQHSGQHLITAVAESMFGYPTTTWKLGSKTSFIELGTPKMTPDEMSRLEVAVNEKIRAGISVTPTLYPDKDDPGLAEARCRGLPDDHEGPVRVLSIDGIDACLCCGTHVHNTSDLQMIKLLSVESGKRKNAVNLNFVCGGRMLEYMDRSLSTERALTALLKGPLEQHFELAEKSVKGYKTSAKTIQNLLRDIAVLEAEKFNSQTDKPPYFIYHKKEGSMDFLNMLLKELNDNTVCCLLTAGEDTAPGVVMISGPEALVKDVGPKIMELLEGKGGYSNGRYQGKANKLANRTKAATLLKDCIQQRHVES